MFLFFRETLEKMLNEGTTIVMDRYAYSGVAYSAAKVKIILWKSDNFQCVGNVIGLVQEP